MTAPQLPLFALPRRLEPGDQGVCLDCSQVSPGGAWGPPGLEEIRLADGSRYTVKLEDQWLCWVCCQQRLETRRSNAPALARRRDRLNAFRAAEAAGYRGVERFRIAETCLRDRGLLDP